MPAKFDHTDQLYGLLADRLEKHLTKRFGPMQAVRVHAAGKLAGTSDFSCESCPTINGS
jgi:hypothetical protein